MADLLSPAMLAVLQTLRNGEPVDGRSWRALEAVTRRGLTEKACVHPLSCSTCQHTGAACGAHIVGTAGHERCTGSGGRVVLSAAGRQALREAALA